MTPDRVFTSPRTLIIGNSGSGKTWLATRMAAAAACPHTPLDNIYWIDQLALQKRGAIAASLLITEAAAGDRWVIEGVYGWLIDAAIPRATQLIWLDLPWSESEAGLLARGPMGVSDTEFDGLIAWARGYWTRQTSSSHAAHAKIFAAFNGAKLRLASRADVAAVGTRRREGQGTGPLDLDTK